MSVAAELTFLGGTGVLPFCGDVTRCLAEGGAVQRLVAEAETPRHRAEVDNAGHRRD
jgi:hypothetical protein